MLSRSLVAPLMGVSFALVTVFGARAAGGSPNAPALVIGNHAATGGSMILSVLPVITAPTVTLTEILGMRSDERGNFTQEPDPTEVGRLFIDTTNGGAILNTPDKQQVKLTVEVTPSTLVAADYEILWEVRDPDDPAKKPHLDKNDKGGDNTGTANESSPGGTWFWVADHATIGTPFNRAPGDENTVIGEARTVVAANNDGDLESTIHFYYGDDAGDDYFITAILREKPGGAEVDDDESGRLTVWRKRMFTAYSMVKENDDAYVNNAMLGTDLGTKKDCILPGNNKLSDTLILGGDDRRKKEKVHTGLNGIVETVVNSGGNSFDSSPTVELFRQIYAGDDPDHLPYIDWEVGIVASATPYDEFLHADTLVTYMHGQTTFVHSKSLMSLLGCNLLLTSKSKFSFGDANRPPHCGIATGRLSKISPTTVPKTNIHEIGHLLIGSFEDDPEFHKRHTKKQTCGFRQGIHPQKGHPPSPPSICSRHVSVLRDSVAREFGSAHDHGVGIIMDSSKSRGSLSNATASTGWVATAIPQAAEIPVEGSAPSAALPQPLPFWELEILPLAERFASVSDVRLVLTIRNIGDQPRTTSLPYRHEALWPQWVELTRDGMPLEAAHDEEFISEPATLAPGDQISVVVGLDKFLSSETYRTAGPGIYVALWDGGAIGFAASTAASFEVMSAPPPRFAPGTLESFLRLGRRDETLRSRVLSAWLDLASDASDPRLVAFVASVPPDLMDVHLAFELLESTPDLGVQREVIRLLGGIGRDPLAADRLLDFLEQHPDASLSNLTSLERLRGD